MPGKNAEPVAETGTSTETVNGTISGVGLAATRVEWRAAPVPESVTELSAAGYPDHVAVLLARRGLTNPADAAAFLAPDLDQLHDPLELAGMERAVARLLAARAAGARVAVVGDYDVDGVSGTALLTAVLRACKIDVLPILPHRLRDGYGFQPVHVERAVEAGCAVVVTVDCGTTSHAAAEAALAAGLEVLVTDHHLPPPKPLPEAVVQINPKQAACDYPFDELSGAGLAFKLALAVARACDLAIDPRRLLRIACLGTIADLVPLRGENRIIAALGLEELANTRSPGLRALIRAARLQAPFSTQDVGFRLGPRLNAPGRLGSAEASLELLLSRDPRRATRIASDLDRWNRERQDWERRVAEEAREMASERAAVLGGDMPAILVLWSESWHRGVVGIAAGRLAREFHRPTILLAVEDGQATGSGRSVRGVHLHGFLDRWRDCLPRFGGHAQAVGMTIEVDRLEELRDLWEEAAAGEWSEVLAVRTLEYELELAPGLVTAELFADLQRFEPFGEGNRAPMVRIRGPLELARPPKVFGRGHLSARVRGPDGATMEILGWGWQERADILHRPFEALGYLEFDRYRGGIRLRLTDCRPFSAARKES